MNEQIRSLIKLTAQELNERLVESAETVRDAGTEDEREDALDEIEAIIYTLRNCAYNGRED